MMLVKTEQLVKGCILAKDVKVITNRAIVTKKTILTEKHLEVLEAYLIDSVEVESVLASGEPFVPNEVPKDKKVQQPKNNFISIYSKSVQAYKSQYSKWQAGSTIDYVAVRNVTIQLIEQALKHEKEVFEVYHYSDEYEYIYHHAVASTMISSILAAHLGYEKKDIVQIAIAAFLMDCGMSRIDQRIIQSNSLLNREEFQQIKEHPVMGYQMVSKIPIIQDEIKIAILQHHERPDKSGYPFGLSSEKIHRYSKIIAVADVFHAMICKRKYKAKQSPFKVLELLQQNTFGKFDLEVVNVLIKVISHLSVGAKIVLSDGKEAEVTFLEKEYPTRPLIKLKDTGEFIPLKQRLDLYIDKVIS
ncbi:MULTISPECIES: HD-GYP domain-containing protein [Sutcliffiella]|uniref:HD-GYP domain-containing protein n=1 Tax=Sutcliffiella TaxID=2837511 RepID=UPI0022DD6E0C|nr:MULTISPECIES: HD-GYP domain-containing protein [Sutcliffiella]MED4015714.1 HD-GYP domain-containing protein [Sutcliffiella cohnii]WBL15144.1 HD-GYP domain-containing protein [Sutcliffiella sp. NC1]